LQDQSSDDSRRYTAASLLGELGDKRAISPLLSALNDPSDSVRGNSASSLGTLGAVEAVEPLLEFLVTHEPDEMKLSSQMGAVSALGMLGDKSVINALQDFLKREGNLPFRGPRAVLIIRIMAALYQLGEEQYFNKLVDLLDSSEGMIRVETLATLDRLNNPQVLTIARNLINDFDENISYIAIQILGNRGNLEDLPLLQTILLQKRFVTHRSHRFAARKAIMNIENRLAT
jgi:HEAT repeat protein